MQENNEKIAVIIPCYNEEKSVCAVIDEVRGMLPEAEIWVFDNNSTDKSAALVSEKIAQIRAEILAQNHAQSAILSGSNERETRLHRLDCKVQTAKISA